MKLISCDLKMRSIQQKRCFVYTGYLRECSSKGWLRTSCCWKCNSCCSGPVWLHFGLTSIGLLNHETITICQICLCFSCLNPWIWNWDIRLHGVFGNRVWLKELLYNTRSRKLCLICSNELLINCWYLQRLN